MSLSKKPYKGTRDFFPENKRALDYIFSIMRKTAFEFGYESYDGPLLEEVDLYRAKSGEELINDQIYNFIDRGNREVAIRPEMTPTVARMVALIHREEAKPIRWFSIPNLMRYEKPQKGRLREHWQFNCDIFGAPEGHGELEILTLVIKLLKNFGANESQFEILINDRRIVDFIIKQKMGLNEEKAYKLYKIIDKSKKVGPEALEKMINDLGLDAEAKTVFDKYLAVSSFGDMLHLLKNEGAPQEVIENLVDFSDKLDQLDLIKYFFLTNTLKTEGPLVVVVLTLIFLRSLMRPPCQGLGLALGMLL